MNELFKGLEEQRDVPRESLSVMPRFTADVDLLWAGRGFQCYWIQCPEKSYQSLFQVRWNNERHQVGLRGVGTENEARMWVGAVAMLFHRCSEDHERVQQFLDFGFYVGWGSRRYRTGVEYAT